MMKRHSTGSESDIFMSDVSSDDKEIRHLIYQQFKSLNWTDKTQADWSLFASGFDSQAMLFPAIRPVTPITPRQFQQRMSQLQKKDILTSFSERVTACDVRIYGNVASVVVGCEMQENDKTYTYDVSVMILLKDQNQWRIVSQAWDAASKQVCLSLS